MVCDRVETAGNKCPREQVYICPIVYFSFEIISIYFGIFLEENLGYSLFNFFKKVYIVIPKMEKYMLVKLTLLSHHFLVPNFFPKSRKIQT